MSSSSFCWMDWRPSLSSPANPPVSARLRSSPEDGMRVNRTESSEFGSNQTMLSISEAYQLASQHHRAGRLQQAEAIYRQIMQDVPNHADAIHHLGLIAHQTGHGAPA